MSPNSKQYYINQKKKSVLYWEKHRKNKTQFAFKRAFFDGLFYGIGLSIVMEGLPTLNNLYKTSISFSLTFILFFCIHYFFSYKMKEKYYLKTKKELNL